MYESFARPFGTTDGNNPNWEILVLLLDLYSGYPAGPQRAEVLMNKYQALPKISSLSGLVGVIFAHFERAIPIFC